MLLFCSHEEGYPGPLPESLVFPPVPLFCDDKTIEQPYNGTDLTYRYTMLTKELLWRYGEGQGTFTPPSTPSPGTGVSGLEYAMERLTDGYLADYSKPFFLHLAYENPHVPLFTSFDYQDSAEPSLRGFYGDAVSEMDRSVGAIMDTLQYTGMDENTVIVFLSDNGAWTHPNNGTCLMVSRGLYDIGTGISSRAVKGMSIFDGGSNAPFQGGKGSTWEGGMRVPAFLWGPSSLFPFPGDIIRAPISAMDLFPTLMDLLNLPAPEGVDGVSLKPLLWKTNTSYPHDCIYYWRERDLYAIRCGDYKAHFITRSGFNTSDAGEVHDPPIMFQVNWDPEESVPLTPELVDDYDEQLSYLIMKATAHVSSIERSKSLYLAQNFTLMPCCSDYRNISTPIGDVASDDSYLSLAKALANQQSDSSANVGIWWEKCVCSRFSTQGV